jgi:ribosomal protein L6P/L9E
VKNLYFNKLIQIQENKITVLKKGPFLLIRGPLGSSLLELPKNIFFEKYECHYRLFGLTVEKNLVLTYYKLLLNRIRGVDLGFSELLIVNGVG